MIISYDKNTGRIYGVTEGRLHHGNDINCKIRPEGVKDEDVVNYVVPFKARYKKIVRNGKTIKVGNGYEPNVYFSEFIRDIEAKKINIFDFRLFETNDGEVVFDLVPDEEKKKTAPLDNPVSKVAVDSPEQKIKALEEKLAKLEATIFDKLDSTIYKKSG